MNKLPEREASTQTVIISRTLSICAKFWMTFPVSFIFYSIFLLHLNSESVLKIILRPYFWIVSATAIWSGLSLLRIRWYGWYLFLVSNILVLYETILVLVDYSHHGRLLAFAITTAFQSTMLFLVIKEVRVPYFFPKIRWWESDPRYKLSVSVKISKKNENPLEGEIMDISMGGCFIKTHSYFSQDELILLEFQLFDKTIECEGMVVWRTESKVTHPKGIGVKFNSLSKEALLTLKKAQKKLTQLNRVYQQITVERNWEEYLKKEKRFQGKETMSSEDTEKDNNTNEKK